MGLSHFNTVIASELASLMQLKLYTFLCDYREIQRDIITNIH